MVRPVSLSDARVRAVSEALRPYAWRGLTPEMVSRLALAAVNGHGAADAAPVTRHDVRMGVLVDFLTGPQRTLTRPG